MTKGIGWKQVPGSTKWNACMAAVQWSPLLSFSVCVGVCDACFDWSPQTDDFTVAHASGGVFSTKSQKSVSETQEHSICILLVVISSTAVELPMPSYKMSLQ